MIDKKWQAFMAAYWEARNSGNSAEAERLVTEYYQWNESLTDKQIEM